MYGLYTAELFAHAQTVCTFFSVHAQNPGNVRTIQLCMLITSHGNVWLHTQKWYCALNCITDCNMPLISVHKWAGAVVRVLSVYYFLTDFQVLAYPWMVWPSPTTALWPWLILGLVLQLWSALLPIHPAVVLQTLKLCGTFPMEVQSQTILPYLTIEREEGILEEWFLSATLRVPQQEFSIVTYLIPVLRVMQLFA